MPSPQLTPFNAQERIPANAKGIELCLRVNSKNEITANDGTIYNLKEVSLLYEKSSPERYTNSFNSTPKKRLLEQPNTSQIGLHGSPSSPRVLLSTEQSLTRGMLSKSPKLFSSSQSVDATKELPSMLPSQKSPQIRSHILDTHMTSDFSTTIKPLVTSERLLKQLQSLILLTRTCRDNLDQSIDARTREMLESKYFTATQELAKLETKLNELGYGGCVATLKNKVSQRSNFSINRCQDNVSTIPKDDFSRIIKLPSNYTEQPKQSTAKHRGDSSIWRDRPKQDSASHHLKQQTPKLFIGSNSDNHEQRKNIIIPQTSKVKGSSIFKPNKEFEENEYGLGCTEYDIRKSKGSASFKPSKEFGKTGYGTGYTGYDIQKSSSHSSFRTAHERERQRTDDSYTRRKTSASGPSVQKDRSMKSSLLDAQRIPRNNHAGGDMTGLESFKRNRLEQFSPANEHHSRTRELNRMDEGNRFQNRLPTMQSTDSDKPDVLSKVMDLRKQYKKLRKMKLEARRKLIDEISNKHERERIEDEYFKAQSKTEEIQRKLKQIALKAGIDHNRLLEIALAGDSDSQSETSSRSDDSRFDSRLALQNSNLFSSQESTQSTQEERHSDFDFVDGTLNAGKLAQSYSRPTLDKDHSERNFDKKYRRKDQNGNLPGRNSVQRQDSDNLALSNIKGFKDKLCFVNRGVQTEDMMVNNRYENKDMSSNTKEGGQIGPKFSKPRYDFLDSEGGGEHEYEPLANATENITKDHSSNSDLDEKDVLRKKRLAYFKTHSPNDRPHELAESFIESSQIADILAAPEMSFDDFDEKSATEDIASSEASKHYEGSSELSPSITPRLLPQLPLERGRPKQRSHIVERMEDIRSRLASKPVLFDVSDFSSQGSRDYTNAELEVMDAEAPGFFDEESGNGDDRKYKLYDVSDVETGVMMNVNKEKIESELRSEDQEVSSNWSRVTDQDLEESESRSQNLLKSMLTDLEKLDKIEHEQESYDSILNPDYEKLFENPEEASLDKGRRTDNKTEIILDEGKTVQDSDNTFGYKETESSGKERGNTITISGIDPSNPKTEVVETPSINDFSQPDLEIRTEDEESSQNQLTSYREKIEAIKARLLQSKQSLNSDEREKVGACKEDLSVADQCSLQDRNIGEEEAYESDDESRVPDLILPSLEDSLRSSMDINENSHDYLNSILDDEEIISGKEDLKLPKLSSEQMQVEEEFNFEEIENVESLPPESGLDVSLRQSLELLDRLELLESDSWLTDQNFDELEAKEIISGSSDTMKDFNGNILNLNENQNGSVNLVKQEQQQELTANVESLEIGSTKDFAYSSMQRNDHNDIDLSHKQEDISPLPPHTMPPNDSPKDLEEWNDSDSEMSDSSSNSILRSPFGTKSMPVQTSAKFAEDDSFHGGDRTIENRMIDSEICFESFSDDKDFDEVLAVLGTVPVDGFTLEDNTDNFETTIEEQRIEDKINQFDVIEKLEVIEDSEVIAIAKHDADKAESNASRANTDRDIFDYMQNSDDFSGLNEIESTEAEIHGYETGAQDTQNSISIDDIQRDKANFVEIADVEKTRDILEVTVDEPLFAQIYNSDPDIRDDVMLMKDENGVIEGDKIAGKDLHINASGFETEIKETKMEPVEADSTQGDDSEELWNAFVDGVQKNIPSYEKKTSSEVIKRKDVKALRDLDDDVASFKSFQSVDSVAFENNLKQSVDLPPEATFFSGPEQGDFTFSMGTPFGLEGIVVREATVLQSIDDLQTYEGQNTRGENASLETKFNGDCTQGGMIFNKPEVSDVEEIEFREAKVTENTSGEDLQAYLSILTLDSDFKRLETKDTLETVEHLFKEVEDSGTGQNLAKVPYEPTASVDFQVTGVGPISTDCIGDVDLSPEDKSIFKETSENCEAELVDAEKTLASDRIHDIARGKEDCEFSERVYDDTVTYTDARGVQDADDVDVQANDDADNDNDDADDADDDDLNLGVMPDSETDSQAHSKSSELDEDSEMLQGDINDTKLEGDIRVKIVRSTLEKREEPIEYEAEKIPESLSNDPGSFSNGKMEEEVDETTNNVEDADIITDADSIFNNSNSCDVKILTKNENEKDENLELTDSQPCRESSFINEVIVKELSNGNADDMEGGLQERNTGDLREEYRARADMQHLPNELLDNLPLVISPRSSINAMTMIPSVLLGQNDDDDDVSDTESEKSSHGQASSDSEEEIEFGPGHSRNQKVLDKNHISLQGAVINTQFLEQDSKGVKDPLNELITEKERNDSISEKNCRTEGSSNKLNEKGAGKETCGTQNQTFENEWYDSIQKEKEFIPGVKHNNGNDLHDAVFGKFDRDFGALSGNVDDEIDLSNNASATCCQKTEEPVVAKSSEESNAFYENAKSVSELPEKDRTDLSNKASATCSENLIEDRIDAQSNEELNAVQEKSENISEFAAKTEKVMTRKDSEVDAQKEFEELEDLFGIGDLSDAESEVMSDRPSDSDVTNRSNTMDVGSDSASRNEIVSCSSEATEDFLDPESDNLSDKPSDSHPTNLSDTRDVGSDGTSRDKIVSHSSICEATGDLSDANDGRDDVQADTLIGILDDIPKQDESLNETQAEVDLVKDDFLMTNAKDRTDDKHIDVGELNVTLDKENLNPVGSQDQGNSGVSRNQREMIARLDTTEQEELDEFENLEFMLTESEDNLNSQEENGISEHETEGLDDSFELEMMHDPPSIEIEDDPKAEKFQDEDIYETSSFEAEHEPEEFSEKSLSLKDELEAVFSGRLRSQVSEVSNVLEDNGMTESVSTLYEGFSASSENTFESIDEGLDKATRAEFESSSTHQNMSHSRYGTPVVIDNGSGRTKAGFATQKSPSVVIPAIIGRPNYEQVMGDASGKDFYVGTEAERYRGVLKLTYPIEHGIVTNWDDMEKLWNHVLLEELRIDASEHPILLTEAPFNPRKNRERMIEIMMENYQVPAFYVAIQAVLSLYAAGETTGVVLDCGDGVTHIVPVYDGCSLPHATERIDIAGRDLTSYLMRILMERGYSFNTSAEREICRDIKERLCFVAEDFTSLMDEFEKSSEALKNYVLPDGQVINIGNEQFRCPEILFQPDLIGKDVPGVHEYLYKSIQRCNVDLRNELYSNIVLSGFQTGFALHHSQGGTTMLKGLDIRLRSELCHITTINMVDNITDSINVKSVPEREFLVWCGGAALASMKSFENAWISSDEYFECGVDIVHRKCF